MLPFIFALVTAHPESVSTDTAARAAIAHAIVAMGGEAALKGVSALQLESIGHDYFIDQSERPEGPFVLRYLSTSELRDVKGGRSRIESQQRFSQVPDWTPGRGATIVDEDAAAISSAGRWTPAPRQSYDDGRERIELGPERLLFTALSAPDLAVAGDEQVQANPQHVVTFGWRGRKARLLLNAYTMLPTALEIRTEDENGIWGIITTTTYYSLWTLLPGGVRYPLQTDREWNGVSRSSWTITRVGVNPAIDDTSLAIPVETKHAFAAAPAGGIPALTFDAAKRSEVAPGVVQYAGAWNVGVVQQPDGLVVIEAPIGSRYSAQVLDELAARYPGVRVKAVITTSDAWPHLGGVREYVARGIPVYALDLNRPILQRLLKADYSAHPDALARAPRAGVFRWISGRTVIGSGDTQIELYPVHGENGERMMFAYLPAAKLLYSSDEIQRARNGDFFMPEYLVEVRDAVNREHLGVERIFGFHVGVTPWTEIEAAIGKASAFPAAR